jgi:antitoxin ParD1/3/4
MAVKQRTRNIALTPQLDRFVQDKIASGRYQSASEVVREGLRLMERYERERRQALAGLREKIRAGYEQVRREETVDADDVLAEIEGLSKAARNAAKKRR